MRGNSFRLFCYGVLAVLVTGCGGGGSGGGDSDGTGTVSVGVTDAPVDGAEHVIVEFTGVALKPQDGQEIEINFSAPKQIDLLDFQGQDSELLLDGQQVPAGRYNWIRLKVNADSCDAPATQPASGSYIVLGDDTVIGDEDFETLQVPSGNQSGLKLVSGFTVTAGGHTQFTVDFDLRKSVVKPTNKDCHFLKPALRLVDNTQVGTLMGTVDTSLVNDAAACGDTDPVTGTAVYVFQNADVIPDDVDIVEGADAEPLTTANVTLNPTSGKLEYTVGFLPPGSYTAALTCQAATDDPETDDAISFPQAANVGIVVNQDTVHNFTVPAP